ncbi:MAG TPA: NAD-dependent epimerase/dehydratase family protein [Stellaceae bacterium]|nr:NAD-dependent epimerase/dehydratase family protein [Stellaceae bacterium]
MLGAGGFIGRALSARLAARGTATHALTRGDTGTLSADSDWSRWLDGAEIVIHAATSASPRHELGRFAREIAAAEALGRTAARCGIRRVVLMSSIRAMGEESDSTPFRADAIPEPTDDYGRAKLAIEHAMAGAPGLTILRPPLVYGPEVGGGLRAFLVAIAKGLPLPFASIRNRRAFIFMDNLIDAVERLLGPEVPAGTYLLRDDEEISTPELVRRIARQMNRAPRLLPCPTGLLRAGLSLAGRSDIAMTLIGSLAIDDTATRARLGWRPRASLDEGLAATCRWFREAAR